MADNYKNNRSDDRGRKAKPIPTEQPQNTDAEASLLGAVLIDADAIVKIADSINPEDFFDARNMHVYEAINQLYEKRQAIDVLTLSDQLKTNGYLDMIGGPAYLTELTNFTPTAAHVEQYAEIVAQKSMRRRLIHTSSEISTLGYDESRSLKELIEEAETRLFQVSSQHVKQTVVSIEDILAESFERLDELHKDKQKIRGIPTGFKDIDDTLAGLQRSDLFILAARPSMGKAQPLNAKVLTTSGWTTMGTLRVGDHIASVDNQPSRVIGVYPQGTKQLFRVTFSDGRNTEVCGEHLWTVHFRGWDRARVLTTDQINLLLTKQRYQKRLWIDMYSGEYGHTDFLPIQAWVLGMLVGEGDFGSMRFSTASEHVRARMEIELGEAYKLSYASNYDYRIIQAVNNYERGAPSPIREELKSLGLWGKRSREKFIPDLYKHANYENRRQLLQGLLDADGWVEKNHTVRYATSSPQLADDVVDLARSLGAWATKKSKQPNYIYNGVRKPGLLSYVVTIVHPQPDSLFSIPEKHEPTLATNLRRRRPTFASITPTRQAEAQCIMVSHPSSLYITDDYIVTHNTAFVLNLAHNVAVYAKEPVLLFSLEMSKEQLVDRLLSMQSGVDAWALRTGNLNDSDFEKLGEAMGVLSEAPIYIDDTPGITVSDMRTKARREAHLRPPGLIIVDYLQLMSGGNRFAGEGNRVQEISEISRGLKGIARELNVPLIALSQLSRSVESRTPQIPQLSDLRESGSIEQDADIVAFIYREDYYNPDTDRKNITDILIKKHRNGALRNIELYFDKDKQRFRSIDSQHGNASPFDE